MANEDGKEVITNEARDNNPEAELARLRDMLKERLQAGKTGQDASSGTKTLLHDPQFRSSPGLEMFLKFLLKVSKPPANPALSPKMAKVQGEPSTPEAANNTDIFAGPEKGSGSGDGLPQPGAIRPASSGWVLWLALIISAFFYMVYFWTRAIK